MDGPLVSILIPNYNKALYLRATLESVISQTYQNWECIIVDDHSTDDSWRILKDFSKSDARFKIIRRPELMNKGGSACRNYAFEMSNGEYIQYLDSDDILCKEKLERQLYQVYSNSDHDVYISNWKFSNGRDVISKIKTSRFNNYPRLSIELLIKLWNERSYIPSFCFLTPRKLVIKSGKWDEDLIRNQDGEFFCRVLVNSSSIVYDNYSYGIYVRTEDLNHVSRTISFNAFISVLCSYQSYEETIKPHRYDDIVMKSLVRNYQHLFFQTIDQYPEIAKRALTRIKINSQGFNYDAPFFIKVFLSCGFDLGLMIYRFKVKLVK